MKKAVFIKDVSARLGVDQKLYEMKPKFKGHKYVVVSAILCPFDTLRSETYIFPADRDGNITDWGQLPGSFRGEMNHAKALDGAGYEIV